MRDDLWELGFRGQRGTLLEGGLSGLLDFIWVYYILLCGSRVVGASFFF